MTVWSNQQQQALDLGRRWLDAPAGSVPNVFRLEGWAGTGKTTLAKELYNHVGGNCLAAAFTGKAASVLTKKGIPATTLHRLIYDYVGNDAEKKLLVLKEELKELEDLRIVSRDQALRLEALRRQVKEVAEQARQPSFLLKERSDVSGANLVIIDEHRQLDERMGSDLMSFGTRVLALGDPAQLGPIRGSSYFADGPPDITLTEIHRTAQDNPILRLATIAREGRSLPKGDWGAARVVSKISAAEALVADQILVGTNAKRRAVNARHRELGGHKTPMPCVGERLVAMRNDHEMGILNGTVWVVTQADDQWEPGESTAYIRIRPEEGGTDIGVPCISELFLDDSAQVGWDRGQHMTFGYAITTHRAQGSEWGSVVVLDDWPRRDSHAAWLYTSITRAQEQLVVVNF